MAKRHHFSSHFLFPSLYTIAQIFKINMERRHSKGYGSFIQPYFSFDSDFSLLKIFQGSANKLDYCNFHILKIHSSPRNNRVHMTSSIRYSPHDYILSAISGAFSLILHIGNVFDNIMCQLPNQISLSQLDQCVMLFLGLKVNDIQIYLPIDRGSFSYR